MNTHRREGMTDSLAALTHHRQQADSDGIMVMVSRQALDELLAWYADHARMVAATGAEGDDLMVPCGDPKEMSEALAEIAGALNCPATLDDMLHAIDALLRDGLAGQEVGGGT